MRCQKVLWLISRMTPFAVIGNNSLYCSPGMYVQRGEVCSDIKMHGGGHKKEGELGRKEQVFHQQLPGGQLGAWGCPRHPVGYPLCLEQVSTLLGLGTSTSPARWGDHQAGPADLSWGPVPMWAPAPEGQEHIPQVEKEKFRRWWCRGEARAPLCQGVPVQRVSVKCPSQ